MTPHPAVSGYSLVFTQQHFRASGKADSWPGNAGHCALVTLKPLL